MNQARYYQLLVFEVYFQRNKYKGKENAAVSGYTLLLRNRKLRAEKVGPHRNIFVGGVDGKLKRGTNK
jgi:hypothetical protein